MFFNFFFTKIFMSSMQIVKIAASAVVVSQSLDLKMKQNWV